MERVLLTFEATDGKRYAVIWREGGVVILRNVTDDTEEELAPGSPD